MTVLAHREWVKAHYTKRVTDNVQRSQSPYDQAGSVAYFSMEFGIHESLPGALPEII